MRGNVVAVQREGVDASACVDNRLKVFVWYVVVGGVVRSNAIH